MGHIPIEHGLILATILFALGFCVWANAFPKHAMDSNSVHTKATNFFMTSPLKELSFEALQTNLFKYFMRGVSTNL